MFDKKQYEKPVLEYYGKMTEHTKGSPTQVGSNPIYTGPD
jgi:hypothetical protein